MGGDHHELAELEAAVAASPDNRSLRRHVAAVLVEAAAEDRDRELAVAALGHLQVLLAIEPDDLKALQLAARAASLTSDDDLASRYRRLAEALGGAPGRAASVERPDGPVRWAADGSHDDLPDEEPMWVRVDETEDGSVDLVEVEVPSLTLDDVGGLAEVKDAIRSGFLAPLRNPELREMYGTSLRGGLLLWGPPGCGKTHLARALAGELGSQFLSIGLHEVLDMWLGQSERNLHDVFETARRHAPCVLFLDEVDALGQKRTNLRHSAGRNVVVQLLAELDGLGDANEGVFVVGATNQPWDVDPALRRPGRFDRTILVLPPDLDARRAILERQVLGRPLADDVDLARLAKATDGYSGADLRFVCERAAQRALDRSLSTGTARPIGKADFNVARKEVGPSIGPWLEAARNYAQFTNDGGRYDDLLAYLRTRRML